MRKSHGLRAISCIAFAIAGNATAGAEYSAISAMIETGHRVLSDFSNVDKIAQPGTQMTPEILGAAKDLEPAQSDFEQTVVPAVRAAGNRVALSDAVKAYYAAGSACFDAAKRSSISTRALCDGMRAKEKLLELELKLAEK